MDYYEPEPLHKEMPMKIIKFIFTAISTMFLGMFGGQKEKGARRFGIPGLAVVMNFKRGWPFLLLIPVLIMGYGTNSWLMNKIGIEFAVRLVYAILLSIPFVFYGLWRWVTACVLLIIAFQIHAGSLGYWDLIGDILIEDIIRYATLGILIAFNLFVYEDRQ